MSAFKLKCAVNSGSITSTKSSKLGSKVVHIVDDYAMDTVVPTGGHAINNVCRPELSDAVIWYGFERSAAKV